MHIEITQNSSSGYNYKSQQNLPPSQQNSPPSQQMMNTNGGSVVASLLLKPGDVMLSSGYSSRESLHDDNTTQHHSCACSQNSNQSSPHCKSQGDRNSVGTKSPPPPFSWGVTNATCCAQHTALLQQNEQLMLKNKLLEENNCTLQEELQVARRFYQNTLAELGAQLARAESHIKYLNEAVCASGEAISVIDTQRSKNDPLRLKDSNNNDMARAKNKSKSFVKMKEQLLERNQLLKTDIQKLKVVSTDLPRTSSAPSLNNQMFPDVTARDKNVCSDQRGNNNKHLSKHRQRSPKSSLTGATGESKQIENNRSFDRKNRPIENSNRSNENRSNKNNHRSIDNNDRYIDNNNCNQSKTYQNKTLSVS